MVVTINKGQTVKDAVSNGLLGDPTKEEKIKVSGNDAIKLIGEFPMFEIKYCTIGFIKNNMIYRISYTAPKKKYNSKIEKVMMLMEAK